MDARDVTTDAAGATPTITRYQKLADVMMAAVSDAAAAVPGWGDDLSDPARSARRPVPASVIAMVLDAVDGSPQLSAIDDVYVLDARDTLRFSEAFRPAVTSLLNVVRRLTLMMDVREAKAGRAALNVYGVARRLARNPNNTKIAVHVENIRAELRRLRIGRIMKTSRGSGEKPGEGDGE